MDDKIIIQTLLKNEEKGYEMMIDKYTPYISTIVYNMSHNTLTPSDMEEIVADVFFKIWKKRAHIEGDSLKGLLIKTTRNTCLDAIKKNGQIFLPLDDDVLQKSSSGHLHSLTEQNDQILLIHEAVEAFEEPDKEIFTRFYYFGEKQTAISDFMNINLSTVKTKLKRSKEKLKKALIKGGYDYE